MAIENTYRDSNEILKPSHISEKYKKTYKTIIITFQSKVLEGLLEKNLIKDVEDRKFGSSHGSSSLYEVVEHPEICFYLCPIGAPITVGLLEEMRYALGYENVVMYGTCGVLNQEVSSGKIIIPTKAYRDEGTSYHYVPASDFINITNHNSVTNILKKLGVEYVKGYTWTTDAFYRETEAIYNERLKQGCICVEMEASAVQAFCDLRKINLYNFLYGADSLTETSWDKNLLGVFALDDRVNYFRLALEIAKTVSNK